MTCRIGGVRFECGGWSRAALGCSSGWLAELAVVPCLPSALNHTIRAILAWDIGVTVFLVLAAWLFATEPPGRMAAHAEAQQEGEWTIFALTVAAVVFSFAAIFSEFASLKDATGIERNLHIALVAVTLFVSWMMTHATFALRYAHEYLRP